MLLLLKVLPVWLCLFKIISAIWPLPLHYSKGSKVVWLSPDFQTVYKPLSTMQTWENIQRYLLYVICTPVGSSAWLIFHTDHGGILIPPLCMISPL